ncbi:MAG: betaine--homocysteine S-methyltransferase [Actinomycetia bacterium]|nr:betaine--homocysteine S-methyltransferase [Actinomycetes bacterium]MCP4961043.1 betaine--homocysteine S-methyltransferase [Actinomycetes bacterium]
MDCLRQVLAERDVLLVDGAMGTRLFETGLEPGDAPERMNLDSPGAVAAVHRAYVDAGSDIVLTNSFGGTRFRLALHGLDDRVLEVNAAAARNARAAADEVDRTVLVAGSMGPTGELLIPMGSLDADDARQAFAEQAKGLAEGGADMIWIETMSSLEEAEAAIVGAQSVTSLPIVLTMSFDTAGRTMMGVTATGAAEHLLPLGLSAIGANCGNNLPDTEAAVEEFRQAAPDVLVVSKANAGIPEWVGAELRYSGSPDVMAAHADRVKHLGANIIGACCGSAPEHLAHMRKVLDGDIEIPEVVVQERVDRSGVSSNRARRRRR